MRPLHRVLGLVLMLITAALIDAAAAETFKHSGTLQDIDLHEGTVILAEVGPWHVDQEATVIARRIITLTDATKVAVARRVADNPCGFSGGFVEEPLSVRDLDLYSGEFMTVECEHEGRRLIAVKITLIEPGP